MKEKLLDIGAVLLDLLLSALGLAYFLFMFLGPILLYGLYRGMSVPLSVMDAFIVMGLYCVWVPVMLKANKWLLRLFR